MGKYKFGKPNAEIGLNDLKQALKRVMLVLSYRAYVVVLYWIGCRRSEPLEVKKSDVYVEGDSVFMTIPAYKEGERGGPIELPRNLFGVHWIEELWKHTPEDMPLFRFCDKTGYRIIKRLFPQKSPHWLRHNRVTKLRRLRDQKRISTDDIKSFTGIKSDRTIQRYGMKTREGIRRVAEVLD